MGVNVTARYYVGLTYYLEMATVIGLVWVTMVYFIGVACVSLFICYYFSHISSYWIPTCYPNLILTLVGIICLAFMPESPRFLVANKQFEKGREVMKFIANFNGKKEVKTEDFVFEGEIEYNASLAMQEANEDEDQ